MSSPASSAAPLCTARSIPSPAPSSPASSSGVRGALEGPSLGVLSGPSAGRPRGCVAEAGRARAWSGFVWLVTRCTGLCSSYGGSRRGKRCARKEFLWRGVLGSGSALGGDTPCSQQRRTGGALCARCGLLRWHGPGFVAPAIHRDILRRDGSLSTLAASWQRPAFVGPRFLGTLQSYTVCGSCGAVRLGRRGGDLQGVPTPMATCSAHMALIAARAALHGIGPRYRQRGRAVCLALLSCSSMAWALC